MTYIYLSQEIFSYNLFIWEFFFLGLNIYFIILYFFFKIKNIKQYFFISFIIFISFFFIYNKYYNFILIDILNKNYLNKIYNYIFFNENEINLNEFYFIFILKYCINKIDFLNSYNFIGYNKNLYINHFVFLSKNIIIFLFFVCYYLNYVLYNKLKIDFIKINIFLTSIILCNLLILSLQNLILIIICIEIQNLALIFLLSLKQNDLYIVQLNLRYFILNSLASIFLFFGSLFLYRYFFTFNLIEIYCLLVSLDFNFLEISQLSISFGILFIIIGLFFKIGIGPFGLWLVDIYEYSPLISLIIYSLIPKFGYLMFLFIFYLSTCCFLPFWKNIYLIFGLLSIIIGTFGAISQIRLKKLLAYSSINFLGYIYLSFLGINTYSLIVCIFYFLIYLFLNIFIWYVVIKLETNLGKNLYILDLVYLRNENFILLLGFIFCILSLSGLPPFFIFSLKFLSLNIILTNYFASFIFLICNLVSLFYYLRLIKIICINKSISKFYKNFVNLFVYYYLICLILFLIYPIEFFNFDFFFNYYNNILISYFK